MGMAPTTTIVLNPVRAEAAAVDLIVGSLDRRPRLFLWK